MYTSFQRYLVDRFGGRLYTLKLRFIFTDIVNEGDLVIRLTSNDPTKAIVIGSIMVDSGFENTSFKCKVGKYQYCRHDPVRWTEMHEPLIINAVVRPSDILEMWAWTPKDAELPAVLELTLFMADVVYGPDLEFAISGETFATSVYEV